MYEDTWVQCDNPKCLKWRRINPPHGDALKNESAWYCFMNRDENFNACDDPQVTTAKKKNSFSHFSNVVLCYLIV